MYSFIKDIKFITLVLLLPNQVYEDKLKLKSEKEANRSEDLENTISYERKENVMSFEEKRK
jgi:hypothetical protein